MINLFVYGQSGSGKDIIADYFRDNHLYLKFKCAGTIKQIISEKEGLTASELEEKKRLDERIRKLHWKTGDWMGSDHNAVLNRLSNIIHRDSIEFEILPSQYKGSPIIIDDVRLVNEAEYLLHHGFVGIFCTRTTSEFKEGKHKTENDLFKNGKALELVNKYPNQCTVILNSQFPDYEEFEKTLGSLGKNFTNALNIIAMYNPTGDQLRNTFANNLSRIIPSLFNPEGHPVLENTGEVCVSKNI